MTVSDDYYGFGNVNKARIDEELSLFRNSDLQITTTSSFFTRKQERVLIKRYIFQNAGEFDHFKQPPQNDLLKDIRKPIAGYYGAIADWFDNETMYTWLLGDLMLILYLLAILLGLTLLHLRNFRMYIFSGKSLTKNFLCTCIILMCVLSHSNQRHY